MDDKSLIIISVTLIIVVAIICGTLMLLHENNQRNTSINSTNNTTDRNTTQSSTESTKTSADTSTEWFGYYSDTRTDIMPHEHAEWESEKIKLAESKGFEIMGCNTDGIKNGYDVYTRDGKFAGHIN